MPTQLTLPNQTQHLASSASPPSRVRLCIYLNQIASDDANYLEVRLLTLGM